MTFLSILPFVVILTVVIKFFVNIPQSLPVARKDNKPPLNNEKALAHNQKRLGLFHLIPNFDVRETFALAVTVTSFILALTLVRSEGDGNGLSNLSIPPSLFGVSVVSLFVFMIVDLKSPNPPLALN